MAKHGFINDMLDVKLLILYVTDKLLYPVDTQTLYELCLQDDKLSYFDVMQALPQMVESGHLAETEKGYVITEVDGQKLTKFGDLSGIIAQKRPGDKVTLTYLHNKKKQTKTVTLRNEQGNTKVVKNADLDILGADFREVSKEQKQQLEISYGLEVIKVNGGKMKDAGVPKGFIIQRVNDEAIKTIEDLQDVVKDASTSKEPVLIIRGLYPTGKRGYFVVQLENE